MGKNRVNPPENPGKSNKRRLLLLLRATFFTLVAIYPVLIWLGLHFFSTRALTLFGLVAAGIWLFRARRTKKEVGNIWALPIAIVSLLAGAWALDDARLLKLIPAAINLIMLVFFGMTLFRAPTMIARFALMQTPSLSEEQEKHCRQFTLAWSVFFLLNAALICFLATSSSTFAWTTYTGGISYILMGGLFTGEFILRRFRFREYGDNMIDRFLRTRWPNAIGQSDDKSGLHV